MKRAPAFVLSGAGIGFFIGSSMGIAAGGTAFNAVWLFVPLGAFIGWLLSSRNSAIGIEDEEGAILTENLDQTESAKPLQLNVVQSVFQAVLAILASVWNFQIDILSALGVLETFVRQPFLFVGLCIVASVLFPPIFPIYFLAWLGASHFGIDEQNKYRATVK